MSGSPSEPTAEQLVEELRKASVPELLLHQCSLLASLAYGKLAPEVLDLDQARLAIEALRALQPLLEGEAAGTIRQVTADLQLRFAEAAAPAGDA